VEKIYYLKKVYQILQQYKVVNGEQLLKSEYRNIPERAIPFEGSIFVYCKEARRRGRKKQNVKTAQGQNTIHLQQLLSR